MSTDRLIVETKNQARELFNLQRDSFLRYPQTLSEKIASKLSFDTSSNYDAGPFFCVMHNDTTMISVPSHRHPGMLRLLMNTHEIMDYWREQGGIIGNENDAPPTAWELIEPSQCTLATVKMEPEAAAEWDRLYRMQTGTPSY